ncbi:abortive infection system antitoxin AbiGi family protein [Paenibacillus sp. FSL L8-0663]|uniref:abortive infection system antitoxin AbiGi family protein n=1 Tax=Paenibacillus sp. FSL L8-0663 TaxID=2921606 RepID=UPI0030FBC4ED
MDNAQVIKEPILSFGESQIIFHENDGYVPPEQSANVLFNFMKNLDYLKLILTDKAMVPRYYEETLNYLNIVNIKSIAFPMTCFCDIHLNKLVPHMSFYGHFGIGLNKEWGIKKGIQPIHYINVESHLKHDFSRIFEYALNLSAEEKSGLNNEYDDFLLTNLLYMKPLNGKMLRNEKYEERNFHDEREWRYIPKLSESSTDLPLLVPPEQLNPKAYNIYSNGLRRCQDLWLKLDYKNIKYLIVKGEEDRKELISFIETEISAETIEKHILISKILVFDELKEDW